MKKILLTLSLLVVLPLFFLRTTWAVEEVKDLETTKYTILEVEEHSTPEDCWVIFADGVYDLSEYLPDHDKFMDIREWCGKDMTEDFKDKAGAGRDHREGSYTLLEKYHIGEYLSSFDKGEEVVDADPVLKEDIVEEDIEVTNSSGKYNILVPFLVSFILYWGGYILVKKEKFFGINFYKFNSFWNTILALTLLIPSLGFGVFMILRTQKPELWDIDFDFMYWHVELSLLMGFVALFHFVHRGRQYMRQMMA